MNNFIYSNIYYWDVCSLLLLVSLFLNSYLLLEKLTKLFSFFCNSIIFIMLTGINFWQSGILADTGIVKTGFYSAYILLIEIITIIVIPIIYCKKN